MRASRAASAALLGVALVTAAGCAKSGGSAPATTPTQGPGVMPGPGGRDADEESQAAPDEAPEAGGEGKPEFAKPPEQEKEAPTAGPAERLSLALGELDRAATELGTSLRDCDRACKALGSMERASERICSLNGPDDPEARCKKARERVEAARDKVHRACGGC